MSQAEGKDVQNGFFSVNSDTRVNLFPFRPQNFDFCIRKFEDYGSSCLGIIPRYSYPYANNDIAGEDQIAEGTDIIGDILANIPTIKIREYTQDLKVTTLLNLIDYGMQGFADAGEVIDGMKASEAYATVVKSSIENTDLWIRMLGEGSENNKSDIGKWASGPRAQFDVKMIAIVYNLYYHIMSHTTSNTYQLPFISKQLYDTNGMDGWPTGAESGFGGTSSNSIVGKILNFIGSNYKIVTEPIWKPISNSNGTNIELTIHLFNDILENAVQNYIFVNTITAHNLPLQYGIIQQPPSCYELNISGGRRLFMCSGKFTVNNIGVFRKVSETFITKVRQRAQGEGSIFNDNLVRIPDVYEVKMTFKSLLPDTFNDFMYQFSMQNLDTLVTTGSVETSIFLEVGENIQKEVRGIIEKATAAAQKEAADKSAREAAAAASAQ